MAAFRHADACSRVVAHFVSLFFVFYGSANWRFFVILILPLSDFTLIGSVDPTMFVHGSASAHFRP